MISIIEQISKKEKSMRDKFNQFMQGRYGNDDLNRFLMKIILAAFVLSLFTGRIVFGGVVSLSRIFYWIA